MSNDELAVVWTIRCATVLHVASLALQIRGKERTARVLWSTGVLAHLAHVLGAFHYVHGYSHTRAYLDTARQTEALFGVASGAGLWLNYLFTLVWTADAVWWWADGAHYRARPRWVAVAVHAFLAFMFFNGTVVSASGPARWIGLASVLLLALVWLAQRARFGGSAT